MKTERAPIVERCDFLAAMRGIACSVTIVTTDGMAGQHGATVSAFSSLSADPPSMLICLKTGSRIEKAVHRNGIYSINVLPENACELARRFAGNCDDVLTDRFAGIDLDLVENGGPRFPGASYLNCLVSDTLVHASHTIFIGLVMEVRIVQSTPLTYMNGNFHYLHRHPEQAGSTN